MGHSYRFGGTLESRGNPLIPDWGSQQAVTILNDYVAEVNKDVLAPNAQLAGLVATVVSTDCRDGSCIMELQLKGFAEAMTYVEMFRDGRFRFDYGKTLNFECPIRATSVPATPGVEQSPFPVLLHFDCELPNR